MSLTAPAVARPVPPAPDVHRAAVRDILPVAVSVAPFAVVIGVTTREVGVPGGTGLLAGAALYGGSAHLAALTLIGSGAGLLAVVTTVALVNLRFLVYAAALEPRFRGQPRWFRWLGPQTIVDQTYVLATGRSDLEDPVRFRRYWTTCGTLLGAAWLAAIGVGLTAGAAIPASSPLRFAATALFVGLLAPRLNGPRPVLVAGVAAVVAASTTGLPAGTGLVAGIGAGLLAGALAGRSAA